jgi:hypothetical protein
MNELHTVATSSPIISYILSANRRVIVGLFAGRRFFHIQEHLSNVGAPTENFYNQIGLGDK